MARLFNATTDEVSFAASSRINNLTPLTVMHVYKANTLDTTFRYLSRRGSMLNINSHDSVLELTRVYSVTILTCISSTTISTGTWYCSFFVDGGATVSPRIYHAAIGSALAEVSYTTQTAPAGTLTDDSATAWLIGRRDAARPWAGHIATTRAWAAALTFAQCKEAYYGVFPSADLRLHVEHGWTATDIDWSGGRLTPTITGTTINLHSPIPYNAQAAYSPYVIAATGWGHLLGMRRNQLVQAAA